MGGIAPAQEGVHNKANWPQAEFYSGSFLRQYVYSTSLSPSWVHETDLFWYSWSDQDGTKYWLVDPKKRTKEPLFDHSKLAEALSIALRKPFEANRLPLSPGTGMIDPHAAVYSSQGGNLAFEKKDLDLLRISFGSRMFQYNRKTDVLKEITEEANKELEAERKEQEEKRKAEQDSKKDRVAYGNYSPDGKFYIYAQDHNLFLVEVGKEDQPQRLTTEGTPKFGFGGGAGGNLQLKYNIDTWGVEVEKKEANQDEEKKEQKPVENRKAPGGTWSKDSQSFYIQRTDSSMVRELYLVNSLTEPRPKLSAYKYPMPGEPGPITELWAFRLKDRLMKRLATDKWKEQSIFNINYSTDEISNKLRFIRRDRLQRNMDLCEIDLDTNEVKVLISESTEVGFIESPQVAGASGYTLRYLKPGGDFIWFSERTGWGHFYLYANDGTLKHPLTSGQWRVTGYADLEVEAGKFWVQGVGREPGQDPYFIHNYEVSLDGKNIFLLDPGDGNMKTSLSPSKKYAVSSLSRPDVAPSAQLLDNRGRVLMELEKADLSRLLSTGWKFPEMFKVKAEDGVTDIYGTMYKPYDFDPKKQYPIILYVYPGPQTESVTKGFSTNNTNQRLAQLGFIVIEIGNRGGHPYRSNAYHSFGYYNLRDYGLADKKAGVEQLAARYPWIDINRVGIFGHSGGGFMTAAALLLPPYNEFFKVGVSSAGNHDNNIYNANWAEQHHGLKEVKVKDKDGKETDETKFEIKVPTNAELAKNLKGNLLLVHGDMDNNVHPAGTMRLVNELIKNKKRFDFMLMPGEGHGFGAKQGYFEQMVFEYFAEHLLGDYYRNGAEMNTGRR